MNWIFVKYYWIESFVWQNSNIELNQFGHRSHLREGWSRNPWFWLTCECEKLQYLKNTLKTPKIMWYSLFMIDHDSTNVSTFPLIDLNFLLNWETKLNWNFLRKKMNLIIFKLIFVGNILKIIVWIEFSWNSIWIEYWI